MPLNGDIFKRRAVFLDRDGVINRVFIKDGKSYPPQSIEELEILPGVEQAILSLREAGFLTVIVTNQPDVANGLQTQEVVEKMHDKLRSILELDDIRVCFHADSANCVCRKPKPGMLLESAKNLEINLSKSFMIGDRWRDIKAGHSVGCQTFFIDYGYLEQTPENPDFVVNSLKEASQIILEREKI